MCEIIHVILGFISCHGVRSRGRQSCNLSDNQTSRGPILFPGSRIVEAWKPCSRFSDRLFMTYPLYCLPTPWWHNALSTQKTCVAGAGWMMHYNSQTRLYWITMFQQYFHTTFEEFNRQNVQTPSIFTPSIRVTGVRWFQFPIQLKLMLLDCGRKPENLERSHVDTGRT